MEQQAEYAIAIRSNMMPAMSLEEALSRRNEMVAFVSKIMVDGQDFGVIPGTDKPTLLKPGAEKLATFFGLTKRFQVIESVQDWTGKDHDGEQFFYFWYRCQLWRGDTLIAEGDGSCNSMERKYRYRQADRKCPSCGRATIIKGRDEYGGGWLCFAKKGGCGMKFKDGDSAIEGQQTGQVINPDLADQVNTIQKMAAKRSLIAATLLAVNASEFFTQDMEDLVEGEYTIRQPQPVEDGNEPPRPAKKQVPTPPKPQESKPPIRPLDANALKAMMARKAAAYKGKSANPSEEQLDYCRSSMGKLSLSDPDRHTITLWLFGKDSTTNLSAAECSAIIDWVGAKPPDYEPSQDARIEARACIRAYLIQQEQQEMPIDDFPAVGDDGEPL